MILTRHHISDTRTGGWLAGRPKGERNRCESAKRCVNILIFNEFRKLNKPQQLFRPTTCVRRHVARPTAECSPIIMRVE